MQKIPTVFKRDPENMKRVLPEVNPGCEWVLAGEGHATRKYDGTCCMLDDTGDWWARREIKPGKDAPDDFWLINLDETTGKAVGWVPMASSSFARWHTEALESLARFGDMMGIALVPGTYELCGPKINGNPDRYREHSLILHETAEGYEIADPSFDGLREEMRYLRDLGIEGYVWHHPDGRMAKLKVRDFDLSPAPRDSQETTT